MSRLALDALAGVDDLGPDEARAGIESAVRIYLKDKDRGRVGWRYPDLMRETEGDERVRLDAEVEDELWRTFEEEAAEQEVSVDRLAEQAAFYFAAEVDAGRIVLRMLDDVEPNEAEGREG